MSARALVSSSGCVHASSLLCLPSSHPSCIHAARDFRYKLDVDSSHCILAIQCFHGFNCPEPLPSQIMKHEHLAVISGALCGPFVPYSLVPACISSVCCLSQDPPTHLLCLGFIQLPQALTRVVFLLLGSELRSHSHSLPQN